MTNNRFLIIGYGNMGKLHTQILASLVPDATFDIVDKKVLNLKNNVYRQINFEDIKDPNIYFGIIISTHSNTHLEYFKKLNSFRNIIFVEKPFVNNVTELINFKEMGKKNVFCGFIETHNNLFELARENLTSKPFFIQIERISPPINSSRLVDDVSFDLTVHDLSVVLEKFIEYADITSTKSRMNMKNKQGLYEMNNLLLETKNCITSISSSRLGQKKIRKWKIFTKNEQINIDLIKKELTVTMKNKKIKLQNNQLTQDFNEKTIIDSEINPAEQQMKEYLKSLASNKMHFNYETLIYSHEILFRSE